MLTLEAIERLTIEDRQLALEAILNDDMEIQMAFEVEYPISVTMIEE